MNSENTESLSYKFQRLRERLREAIASGELSGKLPGERALAKQFQVNAKTLSKALTDLAAEGILDRSIGRGTYVKGQAPVATTQARWLVLADPETPESLITPLRAKNEHLQVMTDPIDRIRPSFINQFSAVIDLASDTPESFLRDLVVRNISVVVVGREPKTYSLNAVLPDQQLGASRLARQLLLAGHRNFAVANDYNDVGLVQAVRQVAQHFDSSATVESVSTKDAGAAIAAGATAVICASAQAAKDVMHATKMSPSTATIVAVGMNEEGVPCTGYFVTPEQIATATADLLTPSQSSRPAILWLAGEYVDRGQTPMPTTATPSFGALRQNIPQA